MRKRLNTLAVRAAHLPVLLVVGVLDDLAHAYRCYDRAYNEALARRSVS